MTINELLAIAGLTANDEIPIWDAEATGEPTKKITAQNLAAAVVALANLVTGVKGDAEQNYRHGDVNLTPADIGAPTTTGSGASGIWNINIPFSGSGTTGFKSFTLNEINIDDTLGNWVAGFSDRTNHGTFPVWYDWWTIVRQYESGDFIFQVANQLTNSGTSSYMSFRGKWNNGGSWGPWKDIINYDAVPITSGGTGATTPAGARNNLGIHYTDVSIPIDSTMYTTDLSTTNNHILSVLPINSLSSVCKINGVHPLNGVWYISCDAVQVGTAQVRIFYVTV